MKPGLRRRGRGAAFGESVGCWSVVGGLPRLAAGQRPGAAGWWRVVGGRKSV